MHIHIHSKDNGWSVTYVDNDYVFETPVGLLEHIAKVFEFKGQVYIVDISDSPDISPTGGKLRETSIAGGGESGVQDE